MPITTTNFVAGRMNKSIDERLLPPGEYIDAMNVRLGATETTEIGAVENSKGNDQLTTLQFQGQALSSAAQCIGAYEDGQRETIYWFVHDSNNPVKTGKLDLIVSFNTTNLIVQYHVISTTVLNFDPEFLITGIDLVDGKFLYFTDDKNPPRVIDVVQSYPYPIGLVDQIEEEDISVILKPPGFEDAVGSNIPLSVPGVQLVSLPGQENYIRERFICFAYRYRYLNGGYSATSLFTVPAFATSDFAFDTRNYLNSGMINRFNGAVITFSTGSKRVTEIDLLYKDTNSNVIYVIERFKKEDYGWADDTQKTYTFTNSKIYTVIGNDELLRLYDNVPRIAKAQTIMGNRLLYGNYVDGYNFTRGSAEGSNISLDYNTSYLPLSVEFLELPGGLPGNGDAYTLSGSSVSITNSKITIDLAEIDGKLKQGAALGFNFRIEHAELGGDTALDPCGTANDEFTNGVFDIQFSVTLDQDYQNSYDFLSSSLFLDAIGTGILADGRFNPLATADAGTSFTDLFNNFLSSPTTTCTFTKFNSSITDATAQQGIALTGVSPGSTTFELQILAMNFQNVDQTQTPPVTTNLYEYFRFVLGEIQFTSDIDTSSLHSNRDYETGIVYMDEYARASTVLVSEYNTVYINPVDSVNANKIQVQLSSTAPYWASKYKFVVKPSLGEYNTVFSNFYYVRPSDNMIFFKIEGDNANKVTKGETLIVKADVDGPLSVVEKCEVLDITAESSDFLDQEEGFTDGKQLAGLYMQIKNQNFNVVIPDDSVIAYGKQEARSGSTSGCSQQAFRNVGYPCFTTDPDTGATTNYDIPGGSIIRWSITSGRRAGSRSCEQKRWEWSASFVATRDYADLKRWYDGDNININTAEPGGYEGWNEDDNIANYNSQYFTPSTPINLGPFIGGNPFGFATNLPCLGFSAQLGFCQAIPGDPSSPLYFGTATGLKGCNRIGNNRKAGVTMDIVVFRANTLMVFETEPEDANAELYFDASEMYDIDSSGFHQSGTDIDNGDQNQTATQDAVITLNFSDCYTFGNGVESYRIKDQLAAKSMQLGERTLAVSNQDYKEADRFEGITYSGVFSSNSGTNNLNEFNLGLVNFKDCETSFGPIQVLHARKTDILTLQEDRITYVFAGKNILTDAVGGGVVTSVPEVLGEQVARIEEYGISFNPESFVAYGYDMYFTDTKRGAVLQLSGRTPDTDRLTVVSDQGMRSWFRDRFFENLNTQKLGGYDPYMDEYVLGMNGTPVPIPPLVISCGTQINRTGLAAGTSTVSTVDFGQVIGDVVFPYSISSGSIVISVLWNGTTTTSGTLTGSGNFTWNKSLNTPVNAVVTITAQTAASFFVTLSCPTQETITVVKVAIASTQDSNKFIHAEYFWEDTVNISPVDSDQVQFLNSPLTASFYDAQVGIRSLGVFPYTGVDLTIRSNKINFDDYDWGYPDDNFKYLSSNTLYANTQPDIASLLAAATTIPNSSVVSPSTGLYQATVTNLSLPSGNQYLYLIYDYRKTSCQQFCYDATSPEDACCLCEIPCVAFSCSTLQNNPTIICNQPLTQTYYHTGSGTFPAVGDFVYSSTNCFSSTAVPLISGYYKSETNKYIRCSSNGIVTELVTCT